MSFFLSDKFSCLEVALCRVYSVATPAFFLISIHKEYLSPSISFFFYIYLHLWWIFWKIQNCILFRFTLTISFISVYLNHWHADGYLKKDELMSDMYVNVFYLLLLFFVSISLLLLQPYVVLAGQQIITFSLLSCIHCTSFFKKNIFSDCPDACNTKLQLAQICFQLIL